MISPSSASTARVDVVERVRWWDLADLVALEQVVFDTDPWSAETFWGELAAPGRHYVMCRDEGVLVGYAGVAVTGTEADVQTVAVASSARGRGLGRRLTTAVIEHALDAGATSMLLEVRADNGAAQALYASLGFERIAVRRRYYQPGDVDAHVLRRRPLRVEPVDRVGSTGEAGPSRSSGLGRSAGPGDATDLIGGAA